MAIEIVTKQEQAYGAFNGGEIIENKPIGFNREGGKLKAFSNLFYWAFAEAKVDSTIGLHPHQGFEIMSFVLKGEIRHYDTTGQTWIPLNAGDVQIIRSGSGISHAEFMAKDAQMFQIWFDPNLNKTLGKPASYNDYKAAEFKPAKFEGYSETALVGDHAPIEMDTSGISISRLTLEGQLTNLSWNDSDIHCLYVLSGKISVEGYAANQDDFVLIKDQGEIRISAEPNTEIFRISVPSKLDYPRYQEIMQQRMS